MTVETRPFDPARYLGSDEGAAAFMDEAFQTGDPAFITHALGTVARARGMTQIARDAGVSRESLYRALGGTGNPEFATVLCVMEALGARFGAEVKAA